MKPVWIGGVASVAMMSLVALAQPAWGGSVKCTLKYSLAGWSAGYSTASGSGTITCDNGESARVSLRATGGGLTAGKSKIVNGSGTFSGATSYASGSYRSQPAFCDLDGDGDLDLFGCQRSRCGEPNVGFARILAVFSWTGHAPSRFPWRFHPRIACGSTASS